MSAIERTRGSGLTDARFEKPMEPIARPVEPALADFGPALQPAALAPPPVNPSRPTLAEPARGAMGGTLAAVATKIRFSQTVIGFDGLQRRLAQRISTADAPPVLEKFFTHLYAADAADTTGAVFGWLPDLDRLAAAQGPLLPAVLASASVRALRGSDGDAAGIERAFAMLFGLFGMKSADARYSAYLTASATVAAGGAALTALSATSGKLPTDPALAEAVAALANPQNPVAAPTIVPLTPKARETLADLRSLLDRQVQALAIFVEELHGGLRLIFQDFEKPVF